MSDDKVPPGKAASPSVKSALDALRSAAPVAPAGDGGARSALDALRAAAPAPAAQPGTRSALDALKAAAPTATPAADSGSKSALDALRTAPPAAQPSAPDARSALDALKAAGTAAAAPVADARSALDALRAAAPPPPAARPADSDLGSALAALRSTAPGDEARAEDPLAGLQALKASAPVVVEKADDPLAGLQALKAAAPVETAETDDPLAALHALKAAAPVETVEADDPLAALHALKAAAPVAEAVAEGDDPLAALQAMKSAAPLQAADADDPMAVLQDLKAAMSAPAAEAEDPLAVLPALKAAAPTVEAADDPLAALLGDLDTPPTGPAEDDPLAALFAETPAALADDDPLAALFAETPADPAEDDPLAALFAETPAAQVDDDDPLAALFAETPADPAEDDPLAALFAETPAAQVDDDPLAALFAATPAGADAGGDPLAGLEDILNDPDPLAGLDEFMSAPDPLAGLDDLLAGTAAQAAPAAAALSAFGTLSAPSPAPGAFDRPVFRIAVLGDFSGRASRGALETGPALAARRAIKLDVDTVEDVIDSFATTLVLPIGQDGQGIAVPLKGLDSLHPDELVESVALFAELKGLRQRLSTPSMAAKAVADMQGWAGMFAAPALPTQARSGAQSVPADRKLSDFQTLIGDRQGKLSKPSPVADLIGRIVGPHVVPGPNPEAKALRGAVDQAMSAAMRLVLHHPDFQATEAAWRTVDMLARRIEADEKLDVVLYDVSAEEVAADLAVEEIGKSGLFNLLAAPLMEEGQTGFSAVCALYTFEETPPHAALLGRIGQIGAFIQAPFLTALSPAYLETAKKNRHALVAKAWDSLRTDPVAHWLGVASPRFLMRRLYGAFSEPVDAFDFEEFTLSDGLSGMLWGNPAALAAVLLAQAWTDGGKAMTLGRQMSLGEMPYHIVTDPHGDQVQLPCTERNMTTEKVEETVTRGLMPVIGIKGRDVVRLGSFQSMAGQEIAGRWSGNPPPVREPGSGATLAADIPAGSSAESELDALLAGFGDAPAAADPAAIDADLAALLEGL